ncbi:ROK family protein [Kiritimatiellaeota bacterium B1221]|nr:ROK family protein [Kiritimatiellaeota bacterium B1221]
MSNKASEQTYWLGIDLGGTKILAEVYDQDFNLIGSTKRKTKAELGQEAGIARLLKTAHDALDDAGISKDNLSGVGIGCPGVLNLQTGVLVKAGNIGWYDVAIKKMLEKEFGVPAAVANDVDAGTFGEYMNGAGKGASTVFGIFPGTGIGGALVYQGDIFRGSKWTCMEIGHFQVVPNGAQCGCGRKGCLESVAGRLAIATAASAAVIRGQAPWLSENVGSDPARIKSGALASAVENGDKVIEQIIIDACTALGQALGGVVNLLAPEIMVIGGGLAEAMPALYKKHVEDAMQPKIMDALQGSCKIEIAKLGDHATALGAAAWVRKQETK